MRAARLLQILLLLQNRRRLTSAALAETLEVSRRTILRDVDALTEAGLPVIVFQGNQGGIELGFDYRTRLTGLDTEEAAAMGLILSLPLPAADVLGFGPAVARARAKVWEAFPDCTRALMAQARDQFRAVDQPITADPRLPALAHAVQGRQVVWIGQRQVDPTGLTLLQDGWVLRCALTGDSIPMRDWGRINISARTFTMP